MIFVILFILICSTNVTSLKFVNITNELFQMNNENLGLIAAFGHLNSDGFTDIITLQQGGQKLQVYLGAENSQPFISGSNCSLDSVITSVVPADFNGDSYMDILVTLIEQDSSETIVHILWGNNGSFDCKAGSLFKIVTQPIVIDFNGDMIPDIIGEMKSGSVANRYVWISSRNKNFTKISLQDMTNQTIRIPHSSGLLDLNNDLIADMLVTGDSYIEIWMNSGKNFSQNGSIPYPVKCAKHFQSTFVDLNLDGLIDHILPVCYDEKCTETALLIWNPIISKWEVIFDNFKYDGKNWTFKLPKGTNSEISAYLPVTIRAGDVDLDGYPDFLMLLQHNSETRPVIAKNVPCFNCSQYSQRSLEIIWNIPGLENIKNAEIVSFFDIYEDGILDILVSSKDDNNWKINALRNVEKLDSCFMKVLVLNGLCHNCTYGPNVPGPVVQYNMTKSDGRPHVSTSVQLSQTAFFSMHLPYSVFGLGQTPNFIDTLTVAVPASFDKRVHKREWTQIIPNSQIVVIPNPPDEESKWVKKLFVTPSHYVLLTCFALIGTCIFVAIIVVILHWKERKEDRKEKMQDAYRFHFDAM